VDRTRLSLSAHTLVSTHTDVAASTRETAPARPLTRNERIALVLRGTPEVVVGGLKRHLQLAPPRQLPAVVALRAGGWLALAKVKVDDGNLWDMHPYNLMAGTRQNVFLN